MEFPDEAWCAFAIEQFNADPDASLAASGWAGDFGLVVLRPPDAIGIYLGAPVGGRLPRPVLLEVAELEAKRPSYFAQASVEDWRGLISGQLDPIAAIVQRRLVARGDLTQVVARLGFRGLAQRWLDRIRGEKPVVSSGPPPRR